MNDKLFKQIFAKLLRMFFTAALFAGMTLFSGAVPVAHAATLTVNSTIDAVDANPGNGVCATAGGVCTLRAAIQEANALAGDDIITLPAGTYTLTIVGANEDATATGDLDITSNLTINGAGAATTIIDGGGIDRVLDVVGFFESVGFTVNISGVTIRNGNTKFNQNGGGISALSSGSTLTLINTILNGNRADVGGGVVTQGRLTIVNSTISNNTARQGGGILIAASGVASLVTSTIRGNTADELGGGILDAGNMTLTDSTVNNNSAGNEGGGIFFFGSIMALTNSTISSNSAGNNGGGISHQNGMAILSNVTISSNIADSDMDGVGNGGGIFQSIVNFIVNLMDKANKVRTIRLSALASFTARYRTEGWNLSSDVYLCSV